MTAEVDQQLIDDESAAQPADVLVEDVLVEEVSIDGMCGVY
ncbi:MAG TPA: mycofactocin precursor MftA [Jatrophihabitantaceae bacterium]|jgi:mycofactocin precursor|nr:mycofactocin precursor MftA [Jatrophihabitantaceae bacterium]